MHLQRESFESADEDALAMREVPLTELDPIGALEELLHGDAPLHAGDGRTEAEMDSVSEAEVLSLTCATEIDLVGLWPFAWIAIARGPEEHDPRVDRQLFAVELNGHLRLAEMTLEGSLQADGLLDEVGHELGMRAEILLNIGVLRQEPNHASHQARGGVATRDDQLHHGGDGLASTHLSFAHSVN